MSNEDAGRHSDANRARHYDGTCDTYPDCAFCYDLGTVGLYLIEDGASADER